MPNELVPADADHPFVLHGLIRKRAEIAGLIVQNRAEAKRLTIDLAHIDAAICIFNPDIDIGAIQAKRARAKFRAANGQCTGRVLDAIREANAPLSGDQITEHVMKDRGFDVGDEKMRRLMLNRVRPCLRGLRNRGIVRNAAHPSGMLGWELARR